MNRDGATFLNELLTTSILLFIYSKAMAALFIPEEIGNSVMNQIYGILTFFKTYFDQSISSSFMLGGRSVIRQVNLLASML
jgi:hypothetical protein